MYRANMYTGDGDETHIQINIYSITMTDEGRDMLTKSTWMHHNEGNYIFVSCSCNSEQGAQTGLGNKETDEHIFLILVFKWNLIEGEKK